MAYLADKVFSRCFRGWTAYNQALYIYMRKFKEPQPFVPNTISPISNLTIPINHRSYSAIPSPHEQLLRSKMESDNSASDSNEDDQLSSAFIDRTVRSSFEKTPHDFVPRGALDEIITIKSIHNAMNIKTPTEEDHQLVDFILTKAKATFATAADIDLEPKQLRKVMMLFKEHNFGDHKLLIERWSSSEFKSNTEKGIRHPFASMDVLAKSGYGKTWTKGRIWDFQKTQSTFRVPVFYTDKSNHDLGDFTVPFVGKRNPQSEGGAFGKVSQYEIHPDHIQDPSSPVI